MLERSIRHAWKAKRATHRATPKRRNAHTISDLVLKIDYSVCVRKSRCLSEFSSLMYHSPITIESLTWRVCFSTLVLMGAALPQRNRRTLRGKPKRSFDPPRRRPSSISRLVSEKECPRERAKPRTVTQLDLTARRGLLDDLCAAGLTASG
jgi:hypothetical protein